MGDRAPSGLPGLGPPPPAPEEGVALARVRATLFGTPAIAAALGRYRLDRLLGSGGGGVVWAAYDPQLQRPVAIKVLPPELAAMPARQARLLREARSLAALAHPNVVEVYDVGTATDGTIFFVQALVKGMDLAAWLRHAPRRRDEILAVLRAAGRGILAAHDRGILHRDIKPANILVGDDARVRVADFGLAALAGDDPRAPRSIEAHREGTVTRTGTVLGTPGYMPPEQLRGDVVDARADQYAFCVTIHEALLGCRPAEHDPIAWLSTASVRRRLSARLRSALRRGLDPDPRRRHPDLHPLIEALADPRPTRGRITGTLGTAAIALLLAGPASSEPDLPADSSVMSVVADSPHTEAVRALLDDAEADAIAGRRMDALAKIDRAAELVIATDTPVLDAEIALRRGSVWLRFGDRVPAERELSTAYWIAAEAGHDRVATDAAIKLAMTTARIDVARTWCGHAAAAITRLGDPPELRASLDYSVAVVEHRDGRSIPALRTALRAALRYWWRIDDPVRTGLALSIAAEAAAAQHWLVLADRLATSALVQLASRLGDDAPELARVHELRGTIASRRGELGDAELAYEAALAIRRQHADPLSAMTLYDLASVAVAVGDVALARARYDAALAAMASVEAPDPRVRPGILDGIATLALLEGRPAEAIAWLQPALDELQDTAPDDPLRIRTRVLLGEAADLLGEHAIARHHARDAADALARSAYPDPEDLAAVDALLVDRSAAAAGRSPTRAHR